MSEYLDKCESNFEKLEDKIRKMGIPFMSMKLGAM